MKKIGTLFSLLCIMNMLAIAGLVAYLFGTGRLDKPKVGAIVTMIRHQGTPEKLNEKLFDILEPTPATNPAAASSQPAAADRGTPDPTLGASAQDRLSIAAQAMQQERLRLDARAQELRNQQESLDKKKAEVEAALNKIKDLKEAFDKQVAAAQKKAVDDNFQKSLDLYNELKSKQVKDMFLAMTPDLVASYIEAMDTSRAAEIIGEFKNPDETAFISKVLDRIRTAGTSAASGSPATGGNGSAAAAPGT